MTLYVPDHWSQLDPRKHGGGGNMDFSGNIEDSTLKASDLAVVL